MAYTSGIIKNYTFGGVQTTEIYAKIEKNARKNK